MKNINLNIVPYQKKFQEDFKNISLDWLKKFHLYEDKDLLILDNPEEVILNKGGYIFLAQFENKIVGTIALKKIDEKTCEVQKLGVIHLYQNNGIGTKLLSFCIDRCKNKGYKKIIIETNDKLTKAMEIYKKFNFQEVSPSNMSFDLSNIKMELIL